MNNLIEILHIGDQAEYRLLSQLLAEIHHTDYHFTPCSGSRDVLRQMLSHSFDVILLDFHCDLIDFASGQPQKLAIDNDADTPRISAPELLRGARDQGCETPIIVMTDQIEADVDREAIRAGASDYLIKGRIDSQLLERTIRYAIERKNAELHLSKLAHYDALTNIPNRILFRDRLEHALQRAERKQQPLTLMYMDLDGFKQVNDNFGHDAGDQLLRSCAQRLVECMRKSDSVARIGGDEFTVLLENAESPTDIVRIAEKIVNALSRPHRIDNHDVTTGCSIGIAVYPNAGKDADSLLRNADMAMYRAKQDQNSCFRFFTETMNVEARRQCLLEADLQRAVEQQKFSLRYQPRIDLTRGRIVALKSHLYWYHPQRGWLDGEHFLSLAEDTGLIDALSQWEIQQVCRDSELLRREGVDDIAICVNLSPQHLKDSWLLNHLQQQRALLDLPPEAIELEMSEPAAVENEQEVRHFFAGEEAKDIAVNIRDFGAGVSSMALLQELHLKHIILPPALFNFSEKRSDKLPTTLVNIARHFSRVLVADGLANRNQIATARKLGCPVGQGSYFGDHLSIDSLAENLRKPKLAAS